LLRTTFLLLLLLPLASSAGAATFGNHSLQGNYFFTFHKIDTSVLGFLFTTAVGTITFDGRVTVAVQGTINRNGSIQPFTGLGLYSVDAAGGLQFSVPGFVQAASGSVAFDLNSLLATTVAPGNTLSHEVLLATKVPAEPISASALSGRYFLVQRTITATGSTPRFENSTGAITFDGAGNCALELTTNRNGSATTEGGAGTYRVNPDGTVLLTLAGQADPVTLGFARGRAFAVGTTVSERSRNSHDLFVLTQADTTGLGNAGLGGAYQVVVSAADGTGFSTSAGRALHFGDGRVFYEFRQNRMGIVGTATGNSIILVASNGDLKFGNVPNVAGLFYGGLGASGHSFAAAAVNDPAVYSIAIAIRTPSQPSAASNAASFSGAAAFSPGSLVSIFGINLARQSVLASTLPLPKQLGGASLKIGGVDVPLHFVSPFQINAQVPFDVPPGAAAIVVTLDGAEGSSLGAVVNAAGPGLFTASFDGRGPGIFLHGADFSPVSPSSPARRGEDILIYATGLGAVIPSVESGAAGPANPLVSAVSSVSVEIGGREGQVSFAGLAPGFAGLYQINVRVPPDVTPSPDVSVVVTGGGVLSNTATLPVAP
jgi:uncharacterized protein (TIGR03437 family)